MELPVMGSFVEAGKILWIGTQLELFCLQSEELQSLSSKQTGWGLKVLNCLNY